jgi:hypothetical protein
MLSHRNVNRRALRPLRPERCYLVGNTNKVGHFCAARSLLSLFVHGVSVVNRWSEIIEAVLDRAETGLPPIERRKRLRAPQNASQARGLR